jgi:hypothetical protein
MLSTVLVLSVLVLGFIVGWISGRQLERKQCNEDILRFQRIKKAEQVWLADGKPVSWLEGK